MAKNTLTDAGNAEQKMLTEALQHHSAGNLPEAEKLYRKILAANSRHPQALHMMGLIGLHMKRFDIAEDLVRQAIREQGNVAPYYETLGNIQNARGNLSDAVQSYKQALAIKHDMPDCLNNLSVTLISLKNFEEARLYLGRILTSHPLHFNALSNMAAALQNLEQYKEALEYYKKAVAINNTVASVHYNMARTLKALGRTDEAKASFELTVHNNPNYPNALLQIGQILRDQKLHDDAFPYYQRAIALRPDDGHAHANIGQILHGKGLYDQALTYHKKALELLPDSFEVLNNLGITYKALGKYEDTLDCYIKALAINPDAEETLSNLSGSLKNLGRLDEAIAHCKRAVEIAPHKPWIYSNLLLAMIYSEKISPEELAAEAKKFGKNVADPLLRTRTLKIDRNPDRKLRIGYVTADFTTHAVNYFSEPVFKNHDHKNFEIFAYANVEVEDDVTQRLKKQFDHWRDIKFLDDEDAADVIEEDKIDILVDISSHTRGNRLMTFARKPAPIQITWLAYPATTGMKAIDYRITDKYAEPEGMTEHLNTETLWRMPDMFCCYQEPAAKPSVINHPPYEDNGYITFGCFNNFSRVTDASLQAWKKILQQVPKSRLLLEIMGIESPKLKAEIEERLIKNGLPLDHVILEPRKKENQFVLYNRLDIALDPFPCVGGTTSMDTLYMGVPLITLAGHSFISRIGVTVLSNGGLSELITHSIDDYIALAVSLAKDKDRLKKLRHNLRDKIMASPLMNERLFTQNMENAYRKMWRKYCASGN